jgi:4-amino-4-deoxy-L-arabinose transferase-like glycosyltransferase
MDTVPGARAGAPGAAQRLLLLALVVAFGLRLYRLGAESLWYDESVSVFLARQSIPGLVAHTAGDIHPPGYYALLHLWQLITRPQLGHGLEFLFAWPSLWFGVVIVALLYAIARRLFGVPVALVAAWLAAVNPFQIWYSQEVRMYTLGAALGLLCLWALLQVAQERRRIIWLAVYVVAAALGLYSLYYFAFLLVGLNLIALPLLAAGGKSESRVRRLGAWLLAQVGVLVLYAPWLPVLWRQATEPPVPPWRVPWTNPQAVLASVAETLGALLVGESPPGGVYWPWALLSAAILVLFLVGAGRGSTTPSRKLGASWKVEISPRAHTSIVVAYVFAPITLLYLITLFVTPIYHVRYVFLYAGPFLIAAAGAVLVVGRARRTLGAALMVVLLVVSGLGLVEYWTNPRYRADDHRQAIAALAQAWRPGDAILANAGWPYTLLESYWPAALESWGGAAPPALGEPVRLDNSVQASPAVGAPAVFRAGSIDGSSSLGWGDPASDFFAVSAADTTAALAALGQRYDRLWHYRLYDTVSDPQGVIRAWLADNATLLQETPIPGRDFGLVQLWDLPGRPAIGASETQPDGAQFGAALELSAHTQPASISAGSPIYVNLDWQELPDSRASAAALATSLRLYDAQGNLAAQADAPLAPFGAPEGGDPHPRTALVLPVPVATQPGAYSLELVIYRQEDGQPLPLPDSPRTRLGQLWRLGEVNVNGSLR